MNGAGARETDVMVPTRWEHGSDWHLSLECGTLEAPWIGRPHSLWGSGRCAIRALLEWGRERFGWSRLLVPSFFCQDVLRNLAGALPVALYEDAPDSRAPASIPAGRSDVLLLVNWYGMRGRQRVDTPATVVEDHTHDPLSDWAVDSDAAYAVASLRKTLPLPDGGIVWSPAGNEVPPDREPSLHHLVASHHRLAAMALKRPYRSGAGVEKTAFRELFLEGERALGEGGASGISPFSRQRLPAIPSRSLRDRRARNTTLLREAIAGTPGVRVLDAPFALTLICESQEFRERLRAALIAARIYPAVLWPLEDPVVPGIPGRHLALSRRLLTLHTDARYDRGDMRRVASAVRAAADDITQASGTAERSLRDRQGRRPGA